MADDLRNLEIANPELRRLESALLELSGRGPVGVDPAAEEAMGEDPLKNGCLRSICSVMGLDRSPRRARAKARELFREKENEAWLDRWQRIAGHLVERKAAAAHLREAEQAFAADGTDENWQHFLAARQHHQDVAASETG